MFRQYGPLATTVYELTKPTGSELNGDITYYAERLQGVTGKILEAGVGTGRVLIPLLNKGFDIEGMDQSNDMLKQCQAHLTSYQLDTTLYHEDLASFHMPTTKYEAIIMPTATFCLIETEDKAWQVLSNFYSHLTTGGRLIVDLDMPFYPEIGETTTSIHPISDTDGITLERKTIDIDWLEQHITTLLTYEKWHNGELVQTELQHFLLRWYGLTEFKLMLEKVGFTHITISADYDFGVKPVSTNQLITFEASK
ncbi:MAG: class I SAM-dependent DNA methyltransferase [Vagococcus sp.]